MATVFFGSNRLLTGPADRLSSYGTRIQPPSNSDGLVFGSAFVDGVDVAGNNPGVVTAINQTAFGRFPDGAADDLRHAGRNILVFVHGFANSFEDALTRGAFNRAFLAAGPGNGADMSVIAWSWPSLGEVVNLFGPQLFVPQADYLRDQNMARQSGIHLMTFLANLQPILTDARANGCRSYLLAHSMGNLALESAVTNWFLHGNGAATLFDGVFLAAGDCTSTTFKQPNLAGLSGLASLADRTTIYYSHADHVLQLSAAVNGGAQRLGQDGPDNRSDDTAFPAARYAMVDATQFQDYDVTFLSSHQYYRWSPQCRADLVGRL